MAKRTKARKIGIFAGIVAVILIVLAALYILYYGGYLTGGSQASHTEGIDYSNYAWYLMIPLILVLLAVVASVALLTKVSFKGKKSRAGKMAAIIVSCLTVFGAVVIAFYGGFYVRAYSDDSEVSDIKLQTNAGAGSAELDLGNYTILSASVEEYHAKDKSQYDNYRIVTYDDNWRIVVRLNNTAINTVNQTATGMNLTGVTATLQGYALALPGGTADRAVTGLYAPNTQIGAATYADLDTLVFEGVTRDPRIISFELIILHSDGSELGKAYIHPAVELSKMAWFMDTDIS